MDVKDLVGSRCTDAKQWAEEFMSVIDGMSKSEIDEGLMIAWFASAIETAKDAMWPGSCSVCVSAEEDEYGNIVCSRGCFDPVEPWFYCADFENKYHSKDDERTVSI